MKNNICKNSYNQNSGLFGWCFVCMNGANYYCQIQWVSICSLDCKFFLMEL